MNIKDKTYYIKYYDNYDKDRESYNIWYIDNEYAYIVATKYKNDVRAKNKHNTRWGSLKRLKGYLRDINYKNIEEITEGDVFLELL